MKRKKSIPKGRPVTHARAGGSAAELQIKVF